MKTKARFNGGRLSDNRNTNAWSLKGTVEKIKEAFIDNIEHHEHHERKIEGGYATHSCSCPSG